MAMTLKETLTQLESLGNEKVRKQNKKHGAGENQLAKPMTADDIRPLVATLAPQERVRLMRLLTEQHDVDDPALYAVKPPRPDEFSADEDSLGHTPNGTTVPG